MRIARGVGRLRGVAFACVAKNLSARVQPTSRNPAISCRLLTLPLATSLAHLFPRSPHIDLFLRRSVVELLFYLITVADEVMLAASVTKATPFAATASKASVNA